MSFLATGFVTWGSGLAAVCLQWLRRVTKVEKWNKFFGMRDITLTSVWELGCMFIACSKQFPLHSFCAERNSEHKKTVLSLFNDFLRPFRPFCNSCKRCTGSATGMTSFLLSFFFIRQNFSHSFCPLPLSPPSFPPPPVFLFSYLVNNNIEKSLRTEENSFRGDSGCRMLPHTSYRIVCAPGLWTLWSHVAWIMEIASKGNKKRCKNRQNSWFFPHYSETCSKEIFEAFHSQA